MKPSPGRRNLFLKYLLTQNYMPGTMLIAGKLEGEDPREQ